MSKFKAYQYSSYGMQEHYHSYRDRWYLAEAVDSEVTSLSAENSLLKGVLRQIRYADLMSAAYDHGGELTSVEVAELIQERVSTEQTLVLHPGCKTAWDRGLTNYPHEEHIRDCDRCQEWNRHSIRHSGSTEQTCTQNGNKDTWRDAYHKLWDGSPVEVRMPDGALDEIVGYGGFHVEHLDKNLWFFDLGGCRFNVHGFDIRLQPIETDCWDNERERVGNKPERE